MVKVTVSGMGALKSVEISDEAREEDSEVLGDLIVSASKANENLEIERAKVMPSGMGDLF